MPIRRHIAPDGTLSEARFSRCGRYRTALSRVWSPDLPPEVWIMLNPSTADESANDPTIERVERRARAAGAGGIRVVNLFGLRATDPAELIAAPDPTGPRADAALRHALEGAGRIVCGWGVHGAHLGRGPRVARRLRHAGHVLHVLGLTRDGHPRHPLYVPYRVGPVPWGDAEGQVPPRPGGR